MENNIFRSVLNDVRDGILFDISLYSDDVDKQYEREALFLRFENLQETTVKYILSNARASLSGSSIGVDFLKKYGFDSKKFDGHYDLEFLESYLVEVFSQFGCPGYLPSIDDIDSQLSIFDFSSKTDDKKFSSLYHALKNCDTPLFYEMYATASEKGLSNDEIFSVFSKIFKMLQYYNYNSPDIRVLSNVPFLDVEIDEYFKQKSENFSLGSK